MNINDDPPRRQRKPRRVDGTQLWFMILANMAELIDVPNYRITADEAGACLKAAKEIAALFNERIGSSSTVAREEKK